MQPIFALAPPVINATTSQQLIAQPLESSQMLPEQHTEEISE